MNFVIFKSEVRYVSAWDDMKLLIFLTFQIVLFSSVRVGLCRRQALECNISSNLPLSVPFWQFWGRISARARVLLWESMRTSMRTSMQRSYVITRLRKYKVKAKVTKCQYPVEVVRIEHKNNYFFKFYQVCWVTVPDMCLWVLKHRLCEISMLLSEILFICDGP